MSVSDPIGAQAHCERGQRTNVSGAVSGSWVSVSECSVHTGFLVQQHSPGHKFSFKRAVLRLCDALLHKSHRAHVCYGKTESLIKHGRVQVGPT